MVIRLLSISDTQYLIVLFSSISRYKAIGLPGYGSGAPTPEARRQRDKAMKSQKDWKKKWSAKAEKRLTRASNYGGVNFYVNLIELDYLEKNTL